MLTILLLCCAAWAEELEASYDPVLAPDTTPELRFVSLNHPAAVLVECEVGGRSLSWEFEEVAAGVTHKVPLPRDPRITTASCQVLARFANGHSQGVEVEMSWQFVQLDHAGDADKVSLDIIAQVAVLPAPFEASKATVQALDSRGAVIFEEVIALRGVVGRTTVRWSKDGAHRAAKLRFTLEGEHGEQVVFDMRVQRQSR
jgi:hypothetical protein